ncbi:MAG: ABC transporter substrate-binding protein [Deltaproteobacteria bacterium]|nr:ABC transporter substrate-binding protein [Deltaproteobacteria bacterium]
MLKVLLTWLSLFLFASAHLAVAQAKPEVSTIKVGVLLSLSGGLEQWCEYIKQGILLAQAEDSERHLEIIFEDDRSLDRKATLTAAQQLVNFKKVDFLTSWTASTVPLLNPLATSSKTPFLIGAYDKNVINAGDYIFGAFINYELLPKQIAQFLIEKKKAKRLAILMVSDDWSKNYEIPFVEEVKKLGAELVFRETIATSETDLRTLILKLNQEKVDAVLSPLYSSSLYSFLKQAKELNYNGLIHVGDGMFEEDLKIAGPSAEGVYATQLWLDSPKLSAALKEKLNLDSDPLQLGLIATGYDWVKHMQEIYLKLSTESKPINRETITEMLRTYSSQGILGEQMYGKPPATSGESNVVVKNGRYQLLN